MRTTVAAIAMVLAAGTAWAQAPELTTDEQKTMYAVGFLFGQNLANFGLSEADMELVKAGLADSGLKRPARVDMQVFTPKVRELQAARSRERAEAEKKAGQAFIAKAAAEPNSSKTGSGLVMTTIKAGDGAAPAATDKVKVHYTGKLVDGTVFDSSVQRKEPATFPLNGVIPCWTEGVQLMKVGGKSRLVCPAALAYGDRGAPPRIKPGATLVFEVELLEIVKQ